MTSTTIDDRIQALITHARTHGITDAVLTEVMRDGIEGHIHRVPLSGTAHELVDMPDDLFFLLVWSQTTGAEGPMDDFDHLSYDVLIALSGLVTLYDPATGEPAVADSEDTD